MPEKEFLFKLMYAAFLDIRVAAYTKDSHTCFAISDIFHNVPLQMIRAEKGEIRYVDIITNIQQKCEQRNCKIWLDNATANIARLP